MADFVISSVPGAQPPQPQPAQPTGEQWQITSMPEQSLTMGQVASQAVRNLPGSAAQFARDIAQPVLHPIETAKNVAELGTGLVQLAIPGEQGNEETARAVGQFFADRYGGIENIKRTLATDPVGFAADISTVLTGGGAAAVRAGGLAGRAGRVAQAAGRAVDPLAGATRAAGAVARPVGRGVSEVVGAIGTHTSGEPIRVAARAGFEGGQAGADFRAGMRRPPNVEELAASARQGLSAIRARGGAAYRSGMADLAKDKTVLSFDDIDKALSDSVRVKTFKGVSIDPTTEGIRNRIFEAVNEWKQLDPAEFHTPEGMDALKQRLGSIMDSTEFNSPERVVARQAYNSVKREIAKQAPEYSRIMRGYEEALNQVREIEKTLSLNPGANVDTQLRKLSSAMKQSGTATGRRLDLVKMLQEAGAENLQEKLAGIAMSGIAPEGIGRLVGTASLAGSGAAAAMQGPAILANPALLAALAVQSPRAVGEVVHAGGRLAGTVAPVARAIPQGTGLAAFQAGRVGTEDRRRRLAAQLAGQ